ncbi:ribonucleotide reductase inhibitor-domain-containing protein [Podospora appendiculata]|uniref:Ribonucleotide reductase inhibitor-domain-containing protein n=1 Tax=Podospora appendiculata TaxID=314037 RepID=A0AAE1CGF0_9PEZI|nr:ribonucleotide reductase inhibitor-domain-containing protein [Podospora appendiculata]
MSGNSRAKRQFAGASSDPAQRQITSFFNKASPTGGNASTTRTLAEDAAATGPLQGPILPHHIQSSLINVGMRVRKSVPEGYKTGGAYSSFSLWSESELKPSAPRQIPAGTMPSSSSSTAAMRELTPFCGINKVGGLAVQPSPPPVSDMPGLTSSQDSIASTSSITSATAATPANRKRLFITDEEDDDENGLHQIGAAHGGPWLKIDDWLDGEMSPRSLTPVGWENARVMAVPKRRGGGHKSLPVSAAVLADLGQENMAVDDFEEAPFLDYGLGGEMMELE